jgi:hypothetical protein
VEALHRDHLESDEFMSGVRVNTFATSRLSEAITISATRAKLPAGDYAKFLGGWSDGDYLYVALRSVSNREIIKVDVGQSNVFDGLSIERGQESTDARAWPAGTLAYQVLSAATLDCYQQFSEFRYAYFNPNGILTPEYFGEEVYQIDEELWWKSVAASGTEWRLIAGAIEMADVTIYPTDGLSVPNGTYFSLSCATPGALIYYTTDGTDVVVGTSSLYTEPVQLANNAATTIKAVASHSDRWYSDSDQAEATVTTITPTLTTGINNILGSEYWEADGFGTPEAFNTWDGSKWTSALQPGLPYEAYTILLKSNPARWPADLRYKTRFWHRFEINTEGTFGEFNVDWGFQGYLLARYPTGGIGFATFGALTEPTNGTLFEMDAGYYLPLDFYFLAQGGFEYVQYYMHLNAMSPSANLSNFSLTALFIEMPEHTEGVVSPPEIAIDKSPTNGVYESPLELTLTSDTPSADFYVSKDQWMEPEQPKPNHVLEYTAPVELTANLTTLTPYTWQVKAIAMESSHSKESDIVSAEYTVDVCDDFTANQATPARMWPTNFGETVWKGNGGYEPGDGTYTVDITTTGIWAVDKRWTHIRLYFTGVSTVTLTVYDTNDGVLFTGVAANGHAKALSFGSYDFGRVKMVGSADFILQVLSLGGYSEI